MASVQVTGPDPVRPRPEADPAVPGRVRGGLITPGMLVNAIPDAVLKLDPRTLWRNPVMFIVEVGSVWTTLLAARNPSWFAWAITAWLWLTVVFANLAEAVAEGRGKAQAATLRAARRDTVARRLTHWSPQPGGLRWNEVPFDEIPASGLAQGDHVVVEAGQLVPGDGERSSRASPALTSLRSPGNRRRSSRRIQGGDRSPRSPAGPGSSRTGSSCRSPRSPGRVSWTA